MTVFVVRHLTKYRYKQPVRLREHRLMFRPRDSFDQRLLHSDLMISPEPTRLRWIHDVFGKCVTLFSFDTSSSYIDVESTIRLEHTPENARTSKSKNTPSFTRLSTSPSSCPTCRLVCGGKAGVRMTM
jgi:Bacterial transglutaminase-like N-terminal region